MAVIYVIIIGGFVIGRVMKIVPKIISLVSFLVFLTTSFAVWSATQTELRYFMQPQGVKGSDTPYGNNSSAGKYAKADDANIYYEVYGSGDPFVVLHGGGLGSTYEMGAFIDELRKNYQVIAISTRGHGKSQIGHTQFSLQQRADDIKAVLDDAKITKPVLVLGFSDGGYAGYALAAYYPSMVKKLITIGSGEVLPSNKRFVFSLNEWKSYDAAFIEQQQKLMPEPQRWPDMLAMYEKMWNQVVISKDLFEKIAIPVLVIGGEHDINSPMLTEIAAYQQLPHANIAIIPNTPHPCFLVNFNAVWSAIVSFLAEHE